MQTCVHTGATPHRQMHLNSITHIHIRTHNRIHSVTFAYVCEGLCSCQRNPLSSDSLLLRMGQQQQRVQPPPSTLTRFARNACNFPRICGSIVCVFPDGATGIPTFRRKYVWMCVCACLVDGAGEIWFGEDALGSTGDLRQTRYM